MTEVIVISYSSQIVQNSVVSTQILAIIYRTRLKEYTYYKIQQYADQN